MKWQHSNFRQKYFSVTSHYPITVQIDWFQTVSNCFANNIYFCVRARTVQELKAYVKETIPLHINSTRTIKGLSRLGNSPRTATESCEEVNILSH
jgi:hypothetical protein